MSADQPRRFKAKAGDEAIGTISDWAESSAIVLGLDPNAAMMVRLCIEEAVTNVVRHAYDDDPSSHVIQLEARAQSGRLYFALFDDGRPFDPVEAADVPEPEIDDVDLLDLEIGGRGLRLMRTFSKSMRYERKDGVNLLIFTF